MVYDNAAIWDTTWSRYYGKYNRHHQEIWRAVEPSLNGQIVDLGCGPCVMYEGKQVSLVGVDWSEKGLAEARIHYPCGVYIQADAANTGLPSGQFDTVVMYGLLDYFKNWDVIIGEAKRLLRPGGSICATLLQGFEGHDWTEETVTHLLGHKPKQYYRVTGNWIFIEV